MSDPTNDAEDHLYTAESKVPESTSIIDTPVPQLGPKDVLVQNKYVGINASDINYTAGRYDTTLKPPFDTGFEGIGEVVAAGDQSKVKVGQSVLYMMMGAFAEYKLLPAKHVIPVPSSNPKFIPFPVSGLTAAISLDKVGEIQTGEKVLVTAAAGAPVSLLPINYKVESVKDVLKNEYPGGVDVVYESVGGEMFDTCVNSLATKGRLIIIGYISGYESQAGFKPSRLSALPQRLLPKSASVRGFFLFHYTNCIQEYMAKLTTLFTQGKLQSVIDQGEATPKGPFVGLDSVPDAIDYMYQGTNKGKVVVQLGASTSSKL